MKRSRNTIKKVLTIYLVAGAVVAVIFIQMNISDRNAIPITYALDEETKNGDIVLEISETEEIGEKETTEEDDEAASDELEAIADADVSTDQKNEKEFYKYTTTNRYNHLRVRSGPDTSETIIDNLMPGASGYVIEKGDEWSYIMTDTTKGYSSNSYLSFTQIDESELPDEFPEEFR